MSLQVQEIFCNRCSHGNMAGSVFCESCGDPFDCPICPCGAELVTHARFCHRCGTPVQEPSRPAIVAVSTMASQDAPSLSRQQAEEKGAILQMLQKKMIAMHEQASILVAEEKTAAALVAAAQDEASRVAAEQRLAQAKTSCQPVRDALVTLHREFLMAIEIALQTWASLEEWAYAEGVYRGLFENEVSNSRRARLLYALGIVARDGFADVDCARENFSQVLQLDPQNIQAQQALKTLSSRD
jgi:hypothetical protein